MLSPLQKKILIGVCIIVVLIILFFIVNKIILKNSGHGNDPDKPVPHGGGGGNDPDKPVPHGGGGGNDPDKPVPHGGGGKKPPSPFNPPPKDGSVYASLLNEPGGLFLIGSQDDWDNNKDKINNA